MSRSFWIILSLSIGLIASLVANGVQYNAVNELKSQVNEFQKKDQLFQTTRTFINQLINGSNTVADEKRLKEIVTKKVQKQQLFDDSKDDQADLEQKIEIEGIHLEFYKKEEAKVNAIFLAHFPDDQDIPSSEYRLRLKMKWEKNRWKIDDYQFHTG